MFTRFFPPLCLVALLAGCGVKPVTVIDENGFARLAQRMPKELQARRLLTDDGSWLMAFSPLGRGEYGETLFRRLSPSFMFGDSGHVYLGETFAATLLQTSRVRHRSNGFSISHPTQEIDLDMVAILDWNDDGEDEWLVSCLVEPKKGGLTRTYYVLVPPPRDAGERLGGTVAAVYECFGLACNLYVRDSRGVTRTAADPLAPPTEVQDLTPGLQTVTTPPDKKTAESEDGLGEHDL
ncbi:MAG: hypothetical protein LBN96_00700 [Desulfovibrio sp.]|jgi:hypothetical protein|nr:hypothetical protein [Desulfovibrio sp.]